MNKYKIEWDNYPQEMYNKLISDGWHIHIVNNEVISAISPNADYVYSYCKGAKQELKIFSRSHESISSIFKKYNSSKSNEMEEKLKMWDNACSFDNLH